MIFEWLDVHMESAHPWALQTLYKNELEMDHSTKCKMKSYTILRNTGDHFYDLESDREFLDTTLKTRLIKEKNDKLGLIKILKKLLLCRSRCYKCEAKLHTGRKYLQITCLTKDLCPE